MASIARFLARLMPSLLSRDSVNDLYDKSLRNRLLLPERRQLPHDPLRQKVIQFTQSRKFLQGLAVGLSSRDLQWPSDSIHS
jgi:hypothetical protein